MVTVSLLGVALALGVVMGVGLVLMLDVGLTDWLTIGVLVGHCANLQFGPRRLT